jgi:hypothetical protein
VWDIVGHRKFLLCLFGGNHVTLCGGALNFHTCDMGKVVTSAYYVFVTVSTCGAAVMFKVDNMGGK